MNHRPHSSPREAPEREAIRRRVKRLYECFGRGEFEKCFSLVDPKLREEQRLVEQSYLSSLRAFHDAYRAIRPWYVRINVHLDATSNKRDPRPFAYVYVVWQDEQHAFHMFKERWVKHGDQWFTRVAGLIVNRQETADDATTSADVRV
jgi:hypothetical protein